MPGPDNTVRALRFSDLPSRKPSRFSLALTETERTTLSHELGLLDLRKARLVGEIAPTGKKDWRLSATLGATVDQPCGITLAPVTTRIDETIERLYLADWDVPEAAEVEMPEDTNAEQLPNVLDLLALFSESLVLALPPFPRAPDAVLETSQYTEPGKVPMTDDEAKPFAGLAQLKLGSDEGSD